MSHNALYTWDFCMTSTAWFRSSSLSAQQWKDSPSKRPELTVSTPSADFSPFPSELLPLVLHSCQSSASMFIVTSDFPLVFARYVFSDSKEVCFFSFDPETVMAFLSSLFTLGFFFTAAWCSLIILTITGVDGSSDKFTRVVQRWALVFLHFREEALAPFSGANLFTFMFRRSMRCHWKGGGTC